MSKYKWHKHKAKSSPYSKGTYTRNADGSYAATYTVNGDFFDAGEVRQASTSIGFSDIRPRGEDLVATESRSTLPDVYWGGDYASGTTGDITIRTGTGGSEVYFISDTHAPIEPRDHPPRAPSGTIYHSVDDGTMRVIDGNGDSIIIAPEESEVGRQLAQLH